MSGLAADIQGILLAYVFFLLMIVSPGPNKLAVMGASMSSGRGAGIAIISLGLQADSSFGFVAAVVSGATILAAGVHCIYAMLFPPLLRFVVTTRPGVGSKQVWVCFSPWPASSYSEARYRRLLHYKTNPVMAGDQV
jgi:hypothetical protein